MQCVGGGTPSYCTVLRTCISISVLDTSSFKSILISLSFEEDSLIEIIESKSFYGYSLLETVDLSNCLHLETLEDATFFNCVRLSSIILPKNGNLTTLNGGVFSRANIETITFPPSLKYLYSSSTMGNSGAFSMCSKLRSIFYYEENNIEIIGFYTFNGNNFTFYSVGSKVTSISGVSFESSPYSFKAISINGTNPKYFVRNGVLYYDTRLVYCPPGNSNLTIDSDITILENEAFSNHISNEIYFLPNSIKTISNYCFLGCKNLQKVHIPASVTAIGSCIFGSCSSLLSIVIPGSISRVQVNVFNNCASLTYVTLSEGVTHINSKAFIFCRKLRFLVIPDTIISISADAFQDSGIANCGIICSSNTQLYIQSILSFPNSSFIECKLSHIIYSCDNQKSRTVPILFHILTYFSFYN